MVGKLVWHMLAVLILLQIRLSYVFNCVLPCYRLEAIWVLFRSASENNIDLYGDSVSQFIRKCIGDVVPTGTIKTYPNQKPQMDEGIRAKLKARTTAFNHGKKSGNISEYKQCSYSLRKAIKQAKQYSTVRYRDKVESQFNSSDTRLMWQGLQEIMDYKKKSNQTPISCFQTN